MTASAGRVAYRVNAQPEQVRPLGSRVLVRPDPLETTIGLIVIPDDVVEKHASKKPTCTGTIIAVGPGMPLKKGGRRAMSDLKAGDKILYRDEGAYKLAMEDTKGEDVLHHMIRDEYIECVFEV